MITYTANCSSDYHTYTRFVTVDKKLDRMPYAQAGILKVKDGLQLVSYETIVCEIVGGWLHCYGTFSNSTRRHIGAFLKEAAPRLTYYDAKMCFADDVEMNVETGEIRPATLGMVRTVGTRRAA